MELVIWTVLHTLEAQQTSSRETVERANYSRDSVCVCVCVSACQPSGSVESWKSTHVRCRLPTLQAAACRDGNSFNCRLLIHFLDLVKQVLQS